MSISHADTACTRDSLSRLDRRAPGKPFLPRTARCCLLLATLLGLSVAQAGPPVLLIHGGAGTLVRDQMSAETEAEIRRTLGLALREGQQVLASGGSAEAAVITSIRVLEESAHFNAGKGAVYDADGGHQLDASLMRGRDRAAGAVAGVRTIRSPILAAQAVMNASPHVLLSGEGADRFAREKKLEQVDNHWFDTPLRLQQFQEWKEKSAATSADTTEAVRRGLLPADRLYGTVGAVALDQSGNLAAGTSTGGMTGKRWGRIGDSPIIGAGTWADSDCAVSSTGHGEYFIRLGLAQRICNRVAFQGLSIAAAADQVIGTELTELGGTGGVIVLGRDGGFAQRFNTAGMYRGWIDAEGNLEVAIYADEHDPD